MDNPVVLNYVRVGYVAVQLIAVLVYLYTSSVVSRNLLLPLALVIYPSFSGIRSRRRTI